MKQETTKNGQKQVNDNTKKSLTVVKKEETKEAQKQELKTETKVLSLEDLQKENELLKAENIKLKTTKKLSIDQAKEVFDSKALILKRIKLFEKNKASFVEMLNHEEGKEDFEEAKKEISLRYNYKDISISNVLVVRTVLMTVIEEIDNKLTELETELLTLNF